LPWRHGYGGELCFHSPVRCFESSSSPAASKATCASARLELPQQRVAQSLLNVQLQGSTPSAIFGFLGVIQRPDGTWRLPRHRPRSGARVGRVQQVLRGAMMTRATHEVVDGSRNASLLDGLIELLLEHRGYSLVQALAPGLRQAGVGDFLGDGGAKL